MPLGEPILIELELDPGYPIAKLINMVLVLAIKDRATEVRFEAHANECKLQYRVRGELLDLVPPPAHMGKNIVNRIQTLAELDFPHRLPVREGTAFFHVPGGFVRATITIKWEEDSSIAIVQFPEPRLDLAASADEVLRRYLNIGAATWPDKPSGDKPRRALSILLFFVLALVLLLLLLWAFRSDPADPRDGGNPESSLPVAPHKLV
jgi:hypothetical protein